MQDSEFPILRFAVYFLKIAKSAAEESAARRIVMRAVVQRVKEASLRVEGKLVSKIPFGLAVFFGVKAGDTQANADYIAKKVAGLRIFEDENGKTNLSIFDVCGEVLSVSQFTLLADCSHGNRPSFTKAAKPQEANRLYELFNSELRAKGLNVQTGVFGADMKVGLINDGPFTVVLE